MARKTFEEQFWAKVDVKGEDECWLWQGHRHSSGYGVFATQPAHRVAYRLTNGDPGSDVVRHTCDVQRCCNPKHLIMGTHAQNVADRMERGRSAPQDGSNNNNAVLDEAAVLEIRRLRAEGVSRRQVAEMFNIAIGTVSCITCRRIWKHI